MKTPWKMFADLVSRKSASPSQGTSSTDGVSSIGYQAQIDDAAPKAPRSIVADETPASVAPSKVASDGLDNHHVEQANAPDDTVPDETPTRLKFRTIKRPAGSGVTKGRKRADAPAEQKTTAAIDVQTEDTLKPKPVLEEWAELDSEILDIRQRLAEKLTLQNTQLREMLERFDRR